MGLKEFNTYIASQGGGAGENYVDPVTGHIKANPSPGSLNNGATAIEKTPLEPVDRAPGLSMVDNLNARPAATVQPAQPKQPEQPTTPGGAVGGANAINQPTEPDNGLPTADGAVGGQAGAFEAPTLPGYTDYSAEIEQLYANQQAAKLAALESAYMEQLAAIDKQAAKVPQYYYEAGRQVTGQNAREQQAMNERFAATGLGSGAQGQAALAQNTVYQGNSAAIKQAEAQALSDIEVDRSALAVQYQDEIKQAILDNETEKAAALYEEMLRLDNGMVQNALAQAELDLKEYQLQTAAQDKDLAALEKRAATMAALGDFSLYKMLGYTDEQIAALTAAYNVPSGGGSSGGALDTAPTMTLTTAKQLAESGYFSTDVLNTLMANGYDMGAIQTVYGYNAPLVAPNNMGVPAQNVINAINRGDDSVTADLIEYYLKGNRITDAEAEYLLALAGV